MKKGWVTKRLVDVTTKIGSGATPRGGDESYKAEGISLIRSLNVYDDGFREAKLARIDDEQADDLSNVIVEPHDVLLNITGASVARCCRAPADFLPARVNQHVSIIRPVQAKLDSDFLHYLLISKIYKDRLLHTGEEGGSTRQAITKAQLQEFVVEFPESLAEQQRIVGLLDEAFEGLVTAKAHAEKNLQNARALFESHLQSVFAQRGQGWAETTIGDQLTLQRGFDITKDQQNTGEVPVVSSGGIKSYHDQAMAKGPGVVIGRKGTLGKVFYLESDYWPHDTTLWVKDFKGNEPRFVYYLFAGLDVKKLDSGAANPALNRNQVHPIEVTWPHVAKQKALVDTLDSLEEETQRLARLYERKYAALEALKKSLLHQAFTGEL